MFALCCFFSAPLRDLPFVIASWSSGVTATRVLGECYLAGTGRRSMGFSPCRPPRSSPTWEGEAPAEPKVWCVRRDLPFVIASSSSDVTATRVDSIQAG